MPCESCVNVDARGWNCNVVGRDQINIVFNDGTGISPQLPIAQGLAVDHGPHQLLSSRWIMSRFKRAPCPPLEQAPTDTSIGGAKLEDLIERLVTDSSGKKFGV